MKIETATPEDIRVVAENMRKADIAEFLPLNAAPTHDLLVDDLVRRFSGHPDVLKVSLDDEPIVIGGPIITRPNVATLMLFATDDFPAVANGLTRFLTRQLFPRYREAGVHRIEAVSIESYETAHRWIEILGLKLEAVLPKFGKGGETYKQFAWVAE